MLPQLKALLNDRPVLQKVALRLVLLWGLLWSVPAAVSLVCNNLGSLAINRALLAPSEDAAQMQARQAQGYLQT